MSFCSPNQCVGMSIRDPLSKCLELFEVSLNGNWPFLALSPSLPRPYFDRMIVEVFLLFLLLAPYVCAIQESSSIAQTNNAIERQARLGDLDLARQSTPDSPSSLSARTFNPGWGPSASEEELFRADSSSPHSDGEKLNLAQKEGHTVNRPPRQNSFPEPSWFSMGPRRSHNIQSQDEGSNLVRK